LVSRLPLGAPTWKRSGMISFRGSRSAGCLGLRPGRCGYLRSAFLIFPVDSWDPVRFGGLLRNRTPRPPKGHNRQIYFPAALRKQHLPPSRPAIIFFGIAWAVLLSFLGCYPLGSFCSFSIYTKLLLFSWQISGPDPAPLTRDYLFPQPSLTSASLTPLFLFVRRFHRCSGKFHIFLFSFVGRELGVSCSLTSFIPSPRIDLVCPSPPFPFAPFARSASFKQSLDRPRTFSVLFPGFFFFFSTVFGAPRPALASYISDFPGPTERGHRRYFLLYAAVFG